MQLDEIIPRIRNLRLTIQHLLPPQLTLSLNPLPNHTLSIPSLPHQPLRNIMLPLLPLKQPPPLRPSRQWTRRINCCQLRASLAHA